MSKRKSLSLAGEHLMPEEIRFDDLTLKQRECMEQVLLHRISKQIAIRADAAQAHARLKA